MPGVETFIRQWASTIGEHVLVLQSQDETHRILGELVERITKALAAEPFTPDPGYQIGADLMAAFVATPQVIGETAALVGQRLLGELGITDPCAPERLARLLGAMVTGYATGLRDRTFAQQEAMAHAAVEVSQRAGERALKRDQITGLPNRELLVHRLAEAAANADSRTRLGLCLINLDRFKMINDVFGHHCGDQVLAAVADQLRRLAGETGHFLAHLGGDEFALLVPGTTGARDVSAVADRALDRVARAIPITDSYQLPIGASAGIVERPAAGADPADLIGAAELALGWAKAERRGRWVVFDPKRGAATAERQALGTAIPDGLAGGEFTVHYQPLVGLATGDLVGVEALVRWRHPTRGLLTPGQFIDVAERTGQIIPLGTRVLQLACVQAARWRRISPRRPPFVSVNVAAEQLHEPGLAAMVTELLDTVDLPSRLLQLEITENALLDPASLATLARLTGMGVRIALDDFGTGYCRLADLSNLPVHTIKTAACFVEFLRAQHTADHGDRTVLTKIIELSHELGLTVIAEGVETAAQARRLAELGCDAGQGFHLGRPEPAERITHRLQLWSLASILRSSRRRVY